MFRRYGPATESGRNLSQSGPGEISGQVVAAAEKAGPNEARDGVEWGGFCSVATKWMASFVRVCGQVDLRPTVV